MSLGGGVEGFTNSSATGTSVGGNWNVRAAIGTERVLGFEASYIGSAQEIDALGLDSDALLVGNGAQAALRANLTTGYDIGVFLLGGVAWRHYAVTNEDFNTSDIRDDDDVLEVPVGAGLDYAYRGFLFDARAEYRFTSYGDLMAARAVTSNEEMNRWGIQANIGYQF
jgi:hypothetical protein